ncbi:MAG: hypothetical protein JWQ12_49 [Glaciihabitans sp.]|nr:hypothetical protein [Glaciihabitans sp.]
MTSPETVITVRGEFTERYAAERALVTLTVTFEGAKRGPVFDRATNASQMVRGGIETRHEAKAGPVVWWASDAINVWSSKPWNSEGKQLAPVFHASVGFRVRISNFAELATWIEEVAALDGVTIDGIEWELTDPRRTAVIAEVRSRAVKDAVSKATVFAQSIGLGTVRAIALADPGMLGDQSSTTGSDYDGRLMASRGGGELSFKPEHIEVSASVDARFLAS